MQAAEAERTEFLTEEEAKRAAAAGGSAAAGSGSGSSASGGGKGRSVDPTMRMTTRYLTKYERARLLGTRALQLRCEAGSAGGGAAHSAALVATRRTVPTPRSYNAPPMVDPKDETDALKIAMLELKENKIPLIVRRYLPDGSYEDWAASELIQ